MKLIILAALAWIFPLTAQSIRVISSTSKPDGTKSVVVNGQSIPSQVIERNGKHYIAVEDLSESLGGTLTFAGQSIVLDLSAVRPKQTPPATALLGRVRGTLTYYFNSNYGNRPDVGAEAWLLHGYPKLPDDAIFSCTDISCNVGNSEFLIVKHTVADGSGNFEFSNLNPGVYTIISQSKHSNGRSQRDVTGKVVEREIYVGSGDTVDAAWDFGKSYTSLP